MPVEESQAAMEANSTAESCVGGGAITIASPPTRQHRGALYVTDTLTNREGPQAREPSKCLNRQSYGERLAKEAF